MNMRRITALSAFLSFFVTLFTSIILYIEPQGRVAYWADWTLFGLSKTQWDSIHINVGFLFLVSLVLHIYYNWKAITAYLKNKAKQLTVFTREFNVSLLVLALFVVGTLGQIPPFSSIIDLSNYFKDGAAKVYGDPPWGHAELSSLKTFTKRMDMNAKESIALLEKAGFNVPDENTTLKEIARINQVSPQKIYLTMKQTGKKPNQSIGKTRELPNSPEPGTGNLTLADFCVQYGLDLKIILRSLNEQKIKATAEMTIKDIGVKNEINPFDVYEKIKTIAMNNRS